MMLLNVRIAVEGNIVTFGFCDTRLFSQTLALVVEFSIVHLTSQPQRLIGELLNDRVITILVCNMGKVVGFRHPVPIGVYVHSWSTRKEVL
jgi:hypothetical protein